jgi:hypothetical protein
VRTRETIRLESSGVPARGSNVRTRVEGHEPVPPYPPEFRAEAVRFAKTTGSGQAEFDAGWRDELKSEAESNVETR